MTRVCMDCNAVIGEKCATCGSTDIAPVGIILTANYPLKCQPCGHVFTRGEGGETHGLCPGCQAERLHAIMTARVEDVGVARFYGRG